MTYYLGPAYDLCLNDATPTANRWCAGPWLQTWLKYKARVRGNAACRLSSENIPPKQIVQSGNLVIWAF